ncbi:MAG: helix-turn-helix domain-containing protein [Pseudomonadota bacterium]|nr:helix-turn-helix domain-containing protein [Pseudomonadota bacterium]
MLSPEQCRAARAWANWSQEDLAKRASVGLSTVRAFEKGTHTPIRNNLEAIRVALETAGVQFTYAGDGKLAGILGAIAHQGERHGATP